MFENMETIRMARAMSGHAATRHAIVAKNIANADTPGYKAQDLAPFFESYRSTFTAPMSRTREGHLTQSGWGSKSSTITDPNAERSPNGNSVSLEDEMIKTADTRREHDLSLAIYQSSLNLLRGALGRR